MARKQVSPGTTASRGAALDLLGYIDASPSPWHAVDSARQRLEAHGYKALDETARWKLKPGGRYYVVRGGSSLVAFALGAKPLAESGFRIIGAHTDSPGLRLKPKAPHSADGVLRVGVEIYGGPILATFADRDLGLAGRVFVREGKGVTPRLLHLDLPLLRLPNLAIHMNREVNEAGLKFNKQTELPLLFGMADQRAAGEVFGARLALALDVAAKDIVSWELGVCDTQKGNLWGLEQEFIASSRLDNLASCHAALSALLKTETPAATAVCGFFDHEEVGSESATGAGGSFMSDVLARIVAASGSDEQDRQRALAQSFFISADMAHAWNPNFPAAYEPNHRVLVNGGPVIKTNANQRYSTGADTAARFIGLCEKAGVPWQEYSHRTDLGCGSTIGPIVAARLGVPSVDVGAPMWSMHSLRESAGAIDHGCMIAVFAQALAS